MRYLVFSDIHGNVQALERIVEEIDALRPDIVVSLGDVVGYGADPARCVEIVDETADIRVAGNHDLAAVGIQSVETFSLTAREAIGWTTRRLDPPHRAAIERFDPIRRHDRCLFAHASPVAPLDWPYISTVGQAREALDASADRFVFVGHTHIPGIIARWPDGECAVVGNGFVQTTPGARYLVNVGSVGQPRDGNAAACFALVDTKKGRISIRRVAYDVGSAQNRIRTSGLPESLASRLAAAR